MNEPNIDNLNSNQTDKKSKYIDASAKNLDMKMSPTAGNAMRIKMGSPTA